uniref:Ubiquitin-like domain-containing protein n=1 Tax=Arion vulgaris TaxID=1028688 RepID=A0A0B7BJ84_9EUPU
MFDFEDINEISGLLPMRVVFQHLPNKSTSIYNVEFPVKSPVHRLKIDIAQRVKIRPEFQKWNYKGRVLDDKDTILNLRIKRDETIFIQQTGPPTQRQQQQQQQQQKKQQSTSDDYKLSEVT